jgi:hypothetical protein
MRDSKGNLPLHPRGCRCVVGVVDGTGEIKIRLGAFDQALPTWRQRLSCGRARERWMQVLPDAEQFAGNRSLLA